MAMQTESTGSGLIAQRTANIEDNSARSACDGRAVDGRMAPRRTAGGSQGCRTSGIVRAVLGRSSLAGLLPDKEATVR